MIPALLSPSVKKSSLATRAFLVQRSRSYDTILSLQFANNKNKQIVRTMGRHYDSLVLQFDGACRSMEQDRDAGSAWVLYDCSSNVVRTIAEGYYFVGTIGTNNVGEYIGLINGLAFLDDEGVTTNSLLIEGHSKLVINQMTGSNQVHSKRLVQLYSAAKNLINALKYNGACREIHFQHVYREMNVVADGLANKAVDTGTTSAYWL